MAEVRLLRLETRKLVNEAAVRVCPNKEADREEMAESNSSGSDGAKPSRLSCNRRPEKSYSE